MKVRVKQLREILDKVENTIYQSDENYIKIPFLDSQDPFRKNIVGNNYVEFKELHFSREINEETGLKEWNLVT